MIHYDDASERDDYAYPACIVEARACSGWGFVWWWMKMMMMLKRWRWRRQWRVTGPVFEVE